MSGHFSGSHFFELLGDTVVPTCLIWIVVVEGNLERMLGNDVVKGKMQLFSIFAVVRIVVVVDIDNVVMIGDLSKFNLGEMFQKSFRNLLRRVGGNSIAVEQLREGSATFDFCAATLCHQSLDPFQAFLDWLAKL